MSVIQVYILVSMLVAFAAMMVEYRNHVTETDQGVVLLNVGLEGVIFFIGWPVMALINTFKWVRESKWK